MCVQWCAARTICTARSEDRMSNSNACYEKLSTLELRFLHKNDVWFIFAPSCLYEGSCLIYVISVCFCIVVSSILSYYMSLPSLFRVVMSAMFGSSQLFERGRMSYCCSFTYSVVKHALTIWVAWRVSCKRQKLLTLRKCT